MKFPEAVGFDVETVGSKPGYGLQPFRALTGEARISAASFAKGDKVTGMLNPSNEQLAQILTGVANAECYVVGWNVAFDASWCIACGCEAEVMNVKWLDAMLLWRHWCVEPEGDDIPQSKRKSFALKAAMEEFFPDFADFKEFDDFEATDAESLRLLLKRNKGDAQFTLRLAEMFWSKLNDKQQRAAMIEAACIPMVAKTKVTGIWTSRELACELSAKLEIEAVALESDLIDSSPEAEGVNLGSPQQLQKLLYDTWGLPILGTSKKTGAPSTDKFVLFDLAMIDPRAKQIKKLREAKNNKTKYPDAVMKSVDYNGDGFIRPSPKIFGTYTSRMTYSSQDKALTVEEKKGEKLPSLWLYHAESESFCVMSEKEYYDEEQSMDLALCSVLGEAKTGSVSELRKLLKAATWPKELIKDHTASLEKQPIPHAVKLVAKKSLIPTGVALHQWKRGKDYRRLIRAPKGFTLVELDAAGQEFRWMAVASEDDKMLELCAPGEDAHSFMGAEVAGVEYRDLVARFHAEEAKAVNDRKAGKFANLSYQYRVSAKTATKKARVEYELEVDHAFILNTQRIYKAAYPGVTAYWKSQIIKCRTLGYAETYAGRRVQLPGNWAGRDAWGNESTAINYPIQGTGGDQKYLALALAKNHLARFGGYFYYELHDGLFFIFPDAVALEATMFFKELLSNMPYEKVWGIKLPIAFPFDASIGKSWGDLKEV